MKKATFPWIYLLFASVILLPAGTLLSTGLGYSFEFIHYPLIAILTAIGMFVCACCCCCLAAGTRKPKLLKIAGLVLSALMAMPVCLFTFFTLLFGNFGKNTVVKTLESPNHTYYAQVIDNDQGALGGDTLVNVYEKGGIHVLIFKIVKKPQQVYRGNWEEFENMEIWWKDERCLVINGVEYVVE